MRVYFIAVWPCNSGLSQATVVPHLEQLATDSRVESIIYFSFESNLPTCSVNCNDKVRHVPILLKKYTVPYLSRLYNHLSAIRVIHAWISKAPPSVVICRGASAGIYGYSLWMKFKIPYYVESFEPHAEYMRQSGTWSRFGIKYLVQSNWEKKIKKTAQALITVSEKYANYLDKYEGISSKRLLTVPCWVDPQKFFFDPVARKKVRKRFCIGDRITCVYSGKFGDLYYEHEAFQALSILREQLDGDLYLILLTPASRMRVEQYLAKYGFKKEDYRLDLVPYESVSGYLSAADFAISFHRSFSMAFSYSPIKYGEYWAAGLPLLAPNGVGDDAEWIDSENVGAVVDMLNKSSLENGMKQICKIVKDTAHREKIRQVALSRRGKACLVDTYTAVIDSALRVQSRL